jgi:AcrR family transcriptional regulator
VANDEPTTTPASALALGKRRAIVKAARARFVAEGYDTSVDAIAADADVSKATVYNHFASKERLFLSVVGDALDEAFAVTLADAESHLRVVEGLRETLIRTCRSWVATVAQPDVLALRNLVAWEIRRFPALGRAWEEGGPKRLNALLRTVLERHVAAGELAVPDLEVAVTQLVALTLYPHLVASAYGVGLSSDLSDRLIDQGVDLFLRGYAA